MSEELLSKLWVDYWSGKGYILCLETERFSDNGKFPGLSELLEQEDASFAMDPQWVLYYRRKGYQITGSCASLEVSHV